MKPRRIARYYYTATNKDNSLEMSRIGADSDAAGIGKIKGLVGSIVGLRIWRNSGVGLTSQQPTLVFDGFEQI